MALQLGALRDALIEAGAGPENAAKAAEEVAGYENRLTRLTTMTQVVIALVLMLLASQGALWLEIGKLNGAVVALNGKSVVLDGKIDALSGKFDALSGKIVRSLAH